MLLYRSSFCLENLHLRLFYLFNGNFSEWSVLSLSLSVLFVFCSLTARGRRGQDQWGKATEWRLAHSCAKKKISKKETATQTTHRENILNTCISFYSFQSAPMGVRMCVCVCACFRKNSEVDIVVGCVVGDTSYTHLLVFFFGACRLQMFCNKNTSRTTHNIRAWSSSLWWAFQTIINQLADLRKKLITLVGATQLSVFKRRLFQNCILGIAVRSTCFVGIKQIFCQHH